MDVYFAGKNRTIVHYFGQDNEFTCLPYNDLRNVEIQDKLLIQHGIELDKVYIKHLYKALWGNFYIFKESDSDYTYIFRENDLEVFINNLKRGLEYERN